MLLLLSVMAGLTLPTTARVQHDAGCQPSAECCEEVLLECDDCHHCPPAPPCPCEDESQPAEDPAQPHEHQHHHHHHNCACSSPGVWLIAESDPFSLEAPPAGIIQLASDFPSPPESPVYLLERPPMA